MYNKLNFKMMKKFLLLVAVFCFLGISVNAQDVFRKGDIVANAQIGIGTYSGYGIGFPPTSVSVDFGAFENLIKGNNGSIGIGGYIGFANYRNKSVNNLITYKNRVMRMCFAARGSFHYQFVDNLDTYAGAMLGLYTYNSKHVVKDNNGNSVVTDEQHTSNAGFAHSLFVGARYYFSDSFGVNAEAGYGFTNIAIGITFKF